MRGRIEAVLQANLADDSLAWELDSTGTWQKVPTVEGFDLHRVLQASALERAQAPR
jgi:hypothetical protein